MDEGLSITNMSCDCYIILTSINHITLTHRQCHLDKVKSRSCSDVDIAELWLPYAMLQWTESAGQ